MAQARKSTRYTFLPRKKTPPPPSHYQDSPKTVDLRKRPLGRGAGVSQGIEKPPLVIGKVTQHSERSIILSFTEQNFSSKQKFRNVLEQCNSHLLC